MWTFPENPIYAPVPFTPSFTVDDGGWNSVPSAEGAVQDAVSTTITISNRPGDNPDVEYSFPADLVNSNGYGEFAFGPRTYDASTSSYYVSVHFQDPDWQVGDESSGSYFKVRVTGVVLAELTLTDHSDPANHAAAVDAVVGQMYDSENDSGNVDLNVSASLAPMPEGVPAPNVVSCRMYQAGVPLGPAFILAGNGTPTEVLVHANDSEFSTWAGQGNVLLSVNNNIVAEWTRDGSWDPNTPGYAFPPSAIAGYDGASLEDLEVDIINSTVDDSHLHVTGKIIRGQKVEVTPLIEDLAWLIGSNTVAAAHAFKYAYFPVAGSLSLPTTGWGEDLVNSVFTIPIPSLPAPPPLPLSATAWRAW